MPTIKENMESIEKSLVEKQENARKQFPQIWNELYDAISRATELLRRNSRPTRFLQVTRKENEHDVSYGFNVEEILPARIDTIVKLVADRYGAAIYVDGPENRNLTLKVELDNDGKPHL